MTDTSYAEHLQNAVPLAQLIRQPEHDRLIDACLKHRYGSVPSEARKNQMTFRVGADESKRWYVTVLDTALSQYMEFTAVVLGDSIFVRGGGMTEKMSRFSMKTLARIS